MTYYYRGFYMYFLKDGFLESAQKHAQLSDLHRRVREWEEKIAPILEKEVKY